MSGYSQKPLAEKLGIKPSSRACFIAAPPQYFQVLTLPDSLTIVPEGETADFVHAFYQERSALERAAPALVESMSPGGMLWISWPKRASGVPTDITEQTLRDIFLPLGVVDVKVAAITEVWSGLKFLRRNPPE